MDTINYTSGIYTFKVGKEKPAPTPTPERIIFNGRTTVVFWSDGSKSMVRCDDVDNYDREMAVAMCLAHKMMGSKAKFKKLVAKGYETMTVEEDNIRQAKKMEKKLLQDENIF